MFKNYYGIGNNVWKFQVSMIKIVPVARIWSFNFMKFMKLKKMMKIYLPLVLYR